MEPAIAGEELVGVFTSAKKVHKFKELARVLRTDIGGLTGEVPLNTYTITGYAIVASPPAEPPERVRTCSTEFAA